MFYLKGILSAVAAMALAELVPGPWSVVPLFSSKATGMAVLRSELLGSLLSPLFWMLAILLFVAFFAASRLGSRPLRISLFWIPTLTVAVVCCGFVTLITYAIFHFRHS